MQARRSWALAVVLCLSPLGCGSDGQVDGPSGGSGGQADAATGGTGTGGVGTGGTGGADSGSGGTAGGGTGGVACPSLAPATLVEPSAATTLVVLGDPGATKGIFDPSVQYPAGAPAGAMSYTAVQATDDIATRIAVSSDAGATWTWVANANASQPFSVQLSKGTPRCPSGTCNGRLVHEVSGLVPDPDDPAPARRWKLFTHSYLVLPGDVTEVVGEHIALFTAPDPAGPWLSEGPALGWDGESAYSSTGAKINVSKFTQTKDCVALTEPSALYRLGGIIDVAVGCASATGGISIRIELFRSLDHGATFIYAGRLLTGADALCLGGGVPEINAADLFFAGGKTYVAATPAGPTSLGINGYRGCVVIPLGAGGDAVERDAQGFPVVALRADAAGNRFVGACAFAEGATAHGLLISELVPEATPGIFTIQKSGLGVP